MNYDKELDEAPYTQSRREFVTLTDSEHEQLFNLTPIRSEVHQFVRDEVNKPWSLQEKKFIGSDSTLRAQLLFSTQLLASFGTSIPQVEHLLKSVPPPMQLEVLTRKRTELINKFAGTSAGKHWMMCMKMKDGWKYVAQYADGDSSRLNLAETETFLATLDHIAVIHDLIRGRAYKYGIDFKAINPESAEEFKHCCAHPEKAQLILELLHKQMDGKDTPKRSSRPIRAALDAAALTEAPAWSFIKKEFGELCKIDKSSYYAYIDKEKECPFEDDTLYSDLKDLFRDYR